MIEVAFGGRNLQKILPFFNSSYPGCVGALSIKSTARSPFSLRCFITDCTNCVETPSLNRLAFIHAIFCDLYIHAIFCDLYRTGNVLKMTFFRILGLDDTPTHWNSKEVLLNLFLPLAFSIFNNFKIVAPFNIRG